MSQFAESVDSPKSERLVENLDQSKNFEFQKGTNNQFHINSKSELALLYNDQSVLENHHISAAFRLMRNPERNILEHLEDNQYRDFRSNVVGELLSRRKFRLFEKLMPRKF